MLNGSGTKATQEPTLKSTDFSDWTPNVKIDQESTDAWKGYFDVVLVGSRGKQKDNDSRISKKIVNNSSPGTDGADAQDKDPSDELSGAVEKQNSLPNIWSDDWKDLFDEALGGSTGKDPRHVQVGAEDQQQYKLPHHNNLGQRTSPTAAATGPEQVSFDRTSNSKQNHQARSPANESATRLPTAVAGRGSTVSMPVNGETTSTQLEHGVFSDPAVQRKGNKEMAERLVHMKPPFNDVPPEAEKDDILRALNAVRMRGARKYRRITATLLRHLLTMDPKPKAFYYDLLFRAHCSPEGSADVIGNLLQEMRQERVHWSSNAYHSVLRVRFRHQHTSSSY